MSENYGDLYQANLDPRGGGVVNFADHGGAEDYDSDASVLVTAHRNTGETCEDASIGLIVQGAKGGKGVDLTPSEARTIAAMLNAAADSADAARGGP